MAYVIPIIILSTLLLIFIIAIIILFATGVFQFRKAPPAPKTTNPSIDPITIRPSHDHLINRTFECEIFILEQSNMAYNDPTSIEYEQASLIIRNAVSPIPMVAPPNPLFS